MSMSRQAIRHDLTRADCAKENFTGIRHDNLMDQFEIWKFGRLEKEVRTVLGQGAVAKAFEEVFELPAGSVQV